MTRAALVGLVALAGAVAAGACGGHLQAFPGALADWRAGRRADAVLAAHAEVERWREGNALGRREVDAAVAAIEARLDEGVPLVVPGDRPPPAPGETPARRDDPAERLRADLLSNRATPVVRALRAAAGLGLVQRGPEILAVVFRREPVTDDEGLFGGASAALRSVVVKRLALAALEQLASAKRPVL